VSLRTEEIEYHFVPCNSGIGNGELGVASAPDTHRVLGPSTTSSGASGFTKPSVILHFGCCSAQFCRSVAEYYRKQVFVSLVPES
jgi:hypothetical protein